MFNASLKQLLGVCALSLIIYSCGQQSSEGRPDQESQDISLLPYSSGKISALNLYIDDVFRPTPVRDSIRLYLEQPYLLVPSPAPSADLVEKSFASFQNGGETNANNLFVVNTKEDSDLNVFARELLGREQIEKALENKNMALIRVKDVYSKPQQLFFLLTKDYPNLQDRTQARVMEGYFQNVLDETINIDNERMVSSVSSRRDRQLEKMIRDKFGVDMFIPREYDFVDSTQNFVWLIKETPELYSNIVFYKSDSSTEALGEKVLEVREELGRNITSTKEGSRMTSNITRPPKPIQRDLEISGKTVYETRGLWEMVNDYLGGSFVNYTFVNNKGEIIAIDGSMYTSEDDKERRLMRDLDAILTTVKIVE